MCGKTHSQGCKKKNIANLDNGKVIHLVIRPADVPHNPVNGKLQSTC
jgi:hypothetical protein